MLKKQVKNLVSDSPDQQLHRTKITQLEKILIRDQEGDVQGAKDIFNEMVDRTMAGENPEGILEEFGLEPDYVFDILDQCV